MPKGNKITQEIINRILELNSDRKTNIEISQTLNISTQIIRKHLRKNNRKMYRINSIILIDSDNARCVDCEIIKPLTSFRKKPTGSYRTSCRSCTSSQQEFRIRNDYRIFLKYRRDEIKNNCIRKNIRFNLSKDFLVNLYEKQNGKCFYTNEKLIISKGEGLLNNSLSVDRIIPSLGYIEGNIVLCLFKVNAAKYNFSLQEIKKWMPKWYKKLLSTDLINRKLL